jgi:predicted nucleic acid-binding protein
MAKLVIDSGVVVKWFVTEPYTIEAQRILADYQAGAVELLAPDLLFAEFGNIIWKKHTLQGMSAPDAQAIISAFQLLNFTVTPSAALLNDAYRLAVAHRRTVYDSLYLALSQRETCQFVTADERLVNALGTSLPGIVWLANWP